MDKEKQDVKLQYVSLWLIFQEITFYEGSF